jgi:hypothetical protein
MERLLPPAGWTRVNVPGLQIHARLPAALQFIPSSPVLSNDLLLQEMTMFHSTGASL